MTEAAGARFRLPRVVCAAGLIVGPPAAVAQVGPRAELTRLSRQERAVVQEWLWHDCDSGADPALERAIGTAGRKLEPVFWEAHRLGPEPGELERTGAAAARRYQSRQAWLRSNEKKPFDAETVRRMLQVNQEAFVRGELDRARLRYQTTALLGLELVGTTASAAALERIASDPRNPTRAAAERALKAIRR